MNEFTKEELQHIIMCLQRTSSYNIAKTEQIISPGVKHQSIIDKLSDTITAMTESKVALMDLRDLFDAL